MEKITSRKSIATGNVKRKAPPKFIHLPPETAKKLKQQWVAKKKLQSAYFGKKKKGKDAIPDEDESKGYMGGKGDDTIMVEEMLVGSSDQESDAEDADVLMEPDDELQPSTRNREPSIETLDGAYVGGMPLGRAASRSNEAVVDVPRPRRKGTTRRGRDFDKTAETLDRPYTGGSRLAGIASRADEPEAGPSRNSQKERSRRGKDVAVESEEPARGYLGGSLLMRVASRNADSEAEVGLSRLDHKEKAKQDKEKALARRALAKAAYSNSTLHTYKSDPLHKGKGSGKGTPGRSSKRSTGKGQPDMKLRMNALLDKIKKNVGVR